MKCEIIHEIDSFGGSMHDPNYHSPRLIRSRCKTHGMPMDIRPTTDLRSDVCPIGQIEEATEKALARIAAATGET